MRTAPLIHRTPTPGGVLKRLKFCLRGLAFASDTKEWFEFLRAPELAVVVEHYPALFHKLQRPYLNRVLNTRQRLEILKQHYGFVAAGFPPPLRNEIYATPGKLLATIPVEKLGTLRLLLKCSHKEKEGDLSIAIFHAETAAEWFTLSFSISRYSASRREIFIGGLQSDKVVSKEIVISMTRCLYGLRPKALLVFALQQLAVGWGVSSVRAVSNDMHIYRHFYKRRHLSASYDEFWTDCGGRLADDGMFDLPAAFIPRDISLIKVNKRKMYKRRYAMLAEAASQIQAAMAWPASPLPKDHSEPSAVASGESLDGAEL